MKKSVFFLMFALVLLTVSSAFASEIVPYSSAIRRLIFPIFFFCPTVTTKQFILHRIHQNSG